MIPSEREVIEVLLKCCEDLYVQNIVLRGMVRRSGVGDWRNKLDTSKESLVANLARQAFQQQYGQAVRNSEELRKFAESLPDSGSPN
jgi:hypothetical protein